MSQSHNQAVTAAIALLAETFPKCFSVYERRRRPLRIGIHRDIKAALGGAITPAELHKALGMYCCSGFWPVVRATHALPDHDNNAPTTAPTMNMAQAARLIGVLVELNIKYSPRSEIPKLPAIDSFAT